MSDVNSGPIAPTEASAVRLELEDIYRAHVQFVWRNARRLGCDDSWVDDAVQEVFLVVARRIGEFEYRSSVTTWLFAITYRVVQRLKRNRWRHLLRLGAFAKHHHAAETHSHPNAEADWELRHLLARLSEPKRAVFILAELEGCTAPEISECLGLPLGTVHTRLRGARQDLERLWQKAELRRGREP